MLLSLRLRKSAKLVDNISGKGAVFNAGIYSSKTFAVSVWKLPLLFWIFSRKFTNVLSPATIEECGNYPCCVGVSTERCSRDRRHGGVQAACEGGEAERRLTRAGSPGYSYKQFLTLQWQHVEIVPGFLQVIISWIIRKLSKIHTWLRDRCLD
jgi:hypothetical protein